MEIHKWNKSTCTLENWGELQNIFSPGLRTTWQFTVKNDGGVNKFYLQYRENTTIKLQGVVQDLTELHRLAQYCLHHAILLLGWHQNSKILYLFHFPFDVNSHCSNSPCLLNLFSWQLPIWVSFFWGGGIFRVTPSGSIGSWIRNPLSAITLSPFSRRSSSLLSLTICSSEAFSPLP